MTDLRIYSTRQGAWTRIDADFSPQLKGAAARAAGEVVLAATEQAMPRRRSPFWVGLGSCAAELPADAEGRALMLALLWAEVGKPGDIYTAVCRKENATRLAAAFRAVAEVG